MYKKIISIVFVFFIVVIPFYAQNRNSTEHLTVSTDRDVYIAGDWLYFSIQLTSEGKNSSDYVYITLSNYSKILNFTGCLKLENNIAYGSIYLEDTISTGVYQLVSYTNCMRNYGSDIFTIKKVVIANRFDSDFSGLVYKTTEQSTDTLLNIPVVPDFNGIAGPEIDLNKEVYKQREKVKLNIKIPKELTNSKFSVSVRKVSPVSFGMPLNSGNTIKSNALCYYMPEKSDLVLQGILKDESKLPVANKTIFLSCEDSIANLQYTKSDESGVFRFFLNPYYFGKTVIVKPDGENLVSINIDSKYNSIKGENSPLLITGNLKDYLQTSQKYLNIQRSYNQIYREEISKTLTNNAYRPSVYTHAPQIVYPSDFIYLPDFREISREELPFFKIREKNNDFVGSVFDMEQKIFTIPFIFLDGVLLEHVRQIMTLDSKKIRKIETIPNTRFVGNLSIPGILNITSNTGEIENIQWKTPVAKVKVENIMPYSGYKVKKFNNIPRNIPGYMQLLYWNPVISVTNGNSVNIELYTSDCTGTFEVVVNGMSQNGEEIKRKKIFNVVP